MADNNGRTLWDLLASWDPADVVMLVFVILMGLTFIVGVATGTGDKPCP
jgi:hypothetical protein